MPAPAHAVTFHTWEERPVEHLLQRAADHVPIFESSSTAEAVKGAVDVEEARDNLIGGPNRNKTP